MFRACIRCLSNEEKLEDDVRLLKQELKSISICLEGLKDSNIYNNDKDWVQSQPPDKLPLHSAAAAVLLQLGLELQ